MPSFDSKLRKGADNPRYLLKKGRLGGSVTELEPTKRDPLPGLTAQKGGCRIGSPVPHANKGY